MWHNKHKGLFIIDVTLKGVRVLTKTFKHTILALKAYSIRTGQRGRGRVRKSPELSDIIYERS